MLKKLRWYTAVLVAFLLGFPMAAPAQAGSGWDIAGAAADLAAAIVDAAGNS